MEKNCSQHNYNYSVVLDNFTMNLHGGQIGMNIKLSACIRLSYYCIHLETVVVIN